MIIWKRNGRFFRPAEKPAIGGADRQPSAPDICNANKLLCMTSILAPAAIIVAALIL